MFIFFHSPAVPETEKCNMFSLFWVVCGQKRHDASLLIQTNAVKKMSSFRQIKLSNACLLKSYQPTLVWNKDAELRVRYNRTKMYSSGYLIVNFQVLSQGKATKQKSLYSC